MLLSEVTILDEYSRECLAIDVARKLNSEDVLSRLAELFVFCGVPTCIRSDNGSELTAKQARQWLARLGVRTLYINPGSPWENGYIESFSGKSRDEFLHRGLLDTHLEARILMARWRRDYSRVRPHSALGYRAPAPEAMAAWAAQDSVWRKERGQASTPCVKPFPARHTLIPLPNTQTPPGA